MFFVIVRNVRPQRGDVASRESAPDSGPHFGTRFAADGLLMCLLFLLLLLSPPRPIRVLEDHRTKGARSSGDAGCSRERRLYRFVQGDVRDGRLNNTATVAAAVWMSMAWSGWPGARSVALKYPLGAFTARRK